MAFFSLRHFFLKIVFLIVYFYALQDFLTSRNAGGTGGDGANRLGVYVSLSGLTVILLLYSVKTLSSRDALPKSILALAVICFWVLADCLFIYLVGSLPNVWHAMITLNAALLWLVISRFIYVYLRQTPDAWPLLQRFIVALFGFYIVYFFAGRLAIQSAYSASSPVLNASYPVLAFLPWFLLFKKKSKVVAFAAIVLLTAISLKRGAILSLGLMTLATFLVDQFNRKHGIRPMLGALLATVLFLGALACVDQATDGKLGERFSEEKLRDGSGRHDRYLLALRVFAESPFLTKLIGSGPSSTAVSLGYGAHNEWLEFLLNFGIIGCGLLFAFFAALFLRLRQLVTRRSRVGPAYACLVTLFTMQSLVSTFYFTQSSIISFMFLGAAEALAAAEKQRQTTAT